MLGAIVIPTPQMGKLSSRDAKQLAQVKQLRIIKELDFNPAAILTYVSCFPEFKDQALR